MSTPIIVDFPLRGEWISPNSPGTRVPSHGIDILGETYAYDFVGVEPGSRSLRFYRPNPLRYLIFGVRLQDCFGWGRPIFSVAHGTVIQAEAGVPERDPVHVARDVAIQARNARAFIIGQSTDYRSLTGNFIIVETNLGYAVYAHCQTGSILVSPGDQVAAGQHIANVGHSGNSTAPHLHFQLMDHPDPWKARGILNGFREYEVFRQDAWVPVQNGIPTATDRIRSSKPPCSDQVQCT